MTVGYQPYPVQHHLTFVKILRVQCVPGCSHPSIHFRRTGFVFRSPREDKGYLMRGLPLRDDLGYIAYIARHTRSSRTTSKP